MITLIINPDICIGCESCKDECPVGAITTEPDGESDRTVCKINPDICVGCETCKENCPMEAIEKED